MRKVSLQFLYHEKIMKHPKQNIIVLSFNDDESDFIDPSSVDKKIKFLQRPSAVID